MCIMMAKNTERLRSFIKKTIIGMTEAFSDTDDDKKCIKIHEDGKYDEIIHSTSNLLDYSETV